MTPFPAEPTAKLLAAMTVEEKISLVSGADVWRTEAVERLGIPSIKVTDGPNGVRGDGTTGARSVCLPAPIAVAASFDPDLVAELGRLLGRETVRKAAHVLLAPTLNLARHPLGGRNFESFGEEPTLAAALAVAYVAGVQDEGVGACAKHLVANDTEDGRLTVSCEVDEATLREVSLVPFEAAVEAGVWTVMAAYPRLNGVHCTHHRWLLTTVLRDEWRFDGLVMSDWGATHGPPAVSAGLDLEMPGPARALGSRLAAAVTAGDVAPDDLDRAAGAVVDLVRRALAAGNAGGAGLSEDGGSEVERSVDDPGDRALVRRAAADGMVLVANRPARTGDPGPVLPLDPASLRTLAVLGPNADPGVVHGGGSAQLRSHQCVSPLEGLRAALPGVAIEHRPGCRSDRYVPVADPAQWIDAGSDGSDGDAGDVGRGPIAMTVYADPELGGEPVERRRTTSIEAFYHGKRRTLPDLDRWSQRWVGRLRAETSGSHRFGVLAVGRSRVLVDGALIADNWTDPRPGQAFFERASEEVVGEVDLRAGDEVDVVVEWSSGLDQELAGLRFGHQPPVDHDQLLADAEAAAADADAAIVVVGLTAEWETESHDRRSLELPGRQDELVRRVAAANPRAVVVLNAGGPVGLPWLDDVPATLIAWYGGQEQGNAIADVLLGARDPGGRLPVTFPTRLADAPTAELVPGDGERLHYAEGLFTGHRWYHRHGIVPRLAFGHGLSYGEHRLDRPTLAGGERPAVTVPVSNDGTRAGTCVVQVYLQPEQADRPRVLAGFASARLGPGERRSLEIGLAPSTMRRWDVGAGAWAPLTGTHQLEIGTASDAIAHRLPFTIP